MRKFYWDTFYEKVFDWECFFVNREKGLFLSVYVDQTKLARKKQNISPTWKIRMKDVELGEPTSFLDHVYVECTQRECQIGKDIVNNCRGMFESRISAGTMENYQKQKPRGNLMPKQYPYGPMTWKVTRRNVWKDIANWQIKRLNTETKSQHHALMIIYLKKKKMSQLENCLQFAHKLF